MWPFSRRKPTPPALPFIKPDDDWQPGNLAQCISGCDVAPAITPGTIAIVSGVHLGFYTDASNRPLSIMGIGLSFEGKHTVDGSFYPAPCFRKLRECGDELDRRAADKVPQRSPETVD